MATNIPVTGETPITIKISIGESAKKFKLPLKDLTADSLFGKLRQLLAIPSDKDVTFERFSDSAGGYVVLDASNPAVFKTLVRAAKAKLKLRLKANVKMEDDTHEDGLSKAPTLAAQLPEVPKGPVLPRTDGELFADKVSTAFGRRALGPGIFDYKQARQAEFDFKHGRQSETSAVATPSEAPLPKPFNVVKTEPTNSPFANSGSPNGLVFRTKPVLDVVKASPAWSIFCNECDSVMSNEHFHCSICDGGDYDLCSKCVSGGKLCPGEGHWLVKRFVKDGQVQSSVTERLQPRTPKSIQVETTNKTEVKKEIPGAFTDDAQTLVEKLFLTSRTCNSCVQILPEEKFVTCKVCSDFDLCLDCHAENSHGHHPAHDFTPAVVSAKLSLLQSSLLVAGRNARHHAICDGCNKNIYGVRHKCFNCPDFDLCNDCIKDSPHKHPNHRFAPIYEPISMPLTPRVKHHGIYCDGPVCTAKSHQTYIEGVRYKCVVCNDMDFCSDCEAAPITMHNPTHPLIKIKSPIRGLNVSTTHENGEGMVHPDLGDRKAGVKRNATSAATSTTTFAATLPVRSSSGASSSVSVKTIADIKPRAAEYQFYQQSSRELNAAFVRDTVTDGTAFTSGSRFTQVWTLKNPGPHAWPAGCSVRFTGGDSMLDLQDNQVCSAAALAEATESNVIGREVQPGEEVAFKVTMKTPSRLGKAISYWRLKSADGTPFGDRLWCDVTVKPESIALPIPHDMSSVPRILNERARSMREQHEEQLRMLQQQQNTFQQNMQKQQLMQMQRHQMALQSSSMMASSFDNHKSVGPAQPSITPSAAANPANYYSQYLERMKALRSAQTPDPMPTHEDRMRQMEDTRGKFADLQARLARQQAARRAARDTQEAMGSQEHWKKQIEDFINRTSSSSSLAPLPAPAVADQVKSEKTEPSQIQSIEVEHIEHAKHVTPELLEDESKAALEGSQMIFPTLEKESPASSLHLSAGAHDMNKGKAAYVEDEEAEARSTITETAAESPIPSIAPSTTSETIQSSADNDGFEDVASEVEVLSADGEMSDDDGFLTDEEYDILDASDQETVASAQ